MKIEIVVDSAGEKIKFVFQVHMCERAPMDLILDKDDFYAEYGEIPFGIHYEVEILSPAVWKSEHWPQSIHATRPKGENSRHFICYPRPIPELTKLEGILEVWCVGTVFTMKTGADFQGCESLQAGDKPRFFREMRDLHRIRFVNTKYVG
jgi:hypothetical protein